MISLAVWKFTSCDGCQLSLLDCQEDLLALGDKISIDYFREATDIAKPGPYDLSIVEGSISTPEEIKRIKEIRNKSKKLITIGACATTGGIQALKNFKDADEFVLTVYTNPEHIETLKTSKAISSYVAVDHELQGCPVDKVILMSVIKSIIYKTQPNNPTHSVCNECKLKGNACVMVVDNIPCMGPVTNAGCGALCPSYNRGCYGCFGPKETPNPEALSKEFSKLGMKDEAIANFYRTFNANALEFTKESNRYEQK